MHLSAKSRNETLTMQLRIMLTSKDDLSRAGARFYLDCFSYKNNVRGLVLCLKITLNALNVNLTLQRVVF